VGGAKLVLGALMYIRNDRASWIDQAILVHIGLHKTATSWLQLHYLSLARHGFWVPPVLPQAKAPIKAVGQMIIADVNNYLIPEEDFEPDEVRLILRQLHKPEDLVPVVSNERLSGHPISNGFDRLILARRIRAIFPKAKILITIREQNAVIMSSYMQYLKFGGWHSPERYIRPLSDARQPALTLQYWDYEKLVRNYHALFGSENVLVLPQELLRRSALDFVGKIASFMGLPSPTQVECDKETNPRRPHVPAYFLRWLSVLARPSSGNSFFPSPLEPQIGKALEGGAKAFVGALVPRPLEHHMERFLSQRLARMVGDHYAASNRRTTDLIGIDLAQFGYKC
jgi:hypothetical protein